MLIHTKTYNKKPYTARIWRCQDHYEHWHSDVEIYICLQGQFCIKLEGVDYHLRAEDVLLVASNESHEIFCDDPNAVTIIIAFGYAFLGNSFNAIQNASFEPAFFNLKDSDISCEIKHPLTGIKDVMVGGCDNEQIKDWKLRGKLYELTAYLYGHMQPVTSKERKLRAKHLENMYGVLEYIGGNYQQKITLEQAAALTGYDKSYFSNQFSNATGMPFHRYLNRYRISVACRYLGDRTRSVSEIAELSGFTSLKMMSRLFRDTLGMTPTQYRNLSSEQKNNLDFLR